MNLSNVFKFNLVVVLSLLVLMKASTVSSQFLLDSLDAEPEEDLSKAVSASATRVAGRKNIAAPATFPMVLNRVKRFFATKSKEQSSYGGYQENGNHEIQYEETGYYPTGYGHQVSPSRGLHIPHLLTLFLSLGLVGYLFFVPSTSSDSTGFNRTVINGPITFGDIDNSADSENDFSITITDNVR